ncbi:hypothetical protein M409DRAFT_68893 [Zasmidium cellare ATCC 36951]|uniref:Uncharacterized protein n=1 Tax=Zasmidium cellare ATCC 36951 TaxID=1080233 RepID=A0A6A6CBR9_ZASCE|nr:uncharacterized protein M409DRAFT_68893 [Zasmidium cellare ATCC 36951]KAF2162916.1 hypothetical protein M409DRAFT_68893 [Zasmidium cellare ATCC 36951]
MSNTSCDALLDNGAITKPDPDISGIGVIIAFIFSACITLVATLGAYAFGMVDEGLLRPVDRLVLRAPSRAAKHVAIHVALRKAILALSDQQIVTGIAILAAGFNGLRLGNITVYHFQIIIYLAWMSSSVHLSALTILRPFMHFHRGVMVWRVIGMMVLFVMLIIALIPTVSNEWAVVTTQFDNGQPVVNAPYSAFGVPASCFWGKIRGAGVNPDSILSFVVLFISYLWKMGGMFQPFRRKFARYLRNPIDRLLEKMLSKPAREYEHRGGQFWLWTFRGALAIYLPLEASLEVMGSFSAALWLSVLGLIYGIMQILIPRMYMMQIDPSVADAESNLGFGQLMPLILLAQPLGAVTEHIWLKKEDDEALYTDYGGADPYSATLGHYQEGRQLIGLPKDPLLHHMASYELPPWKEQAPQRIQLKALLYTSKLFHLMVWLTQAAVAATAAVVFWADYWTIGVVPASNWYFIALAAGGWAAACPVITFSLGPMSRLGMFYKPQPEKLELQTTFAGSSHSTEEQHKATLSPNRVELGPTVTGEVTEVWSSEWRRASVQHPPKSPVSPVAPP